MNLGNDPADQVVRFSLQGTETALKLSGLAAKNFAVFLYALFKDQKKTHGKTHLSRMLQERRPLKFFTVPSDRMKEFAQEARKRGLLFVPIRNQNRPGQIEIVVFADDAAKVNRVLDCLRLDVVQAQAGEAAVSEPESPTQTETVQTKDGKVEFEVGGFDDGIPMEDVGNFTAGRAEETDPSGRSSRSSEPSPGFAGSKPSVWQELHDIRQQVHSKTAGIPQPSKRKTQEKGR